MGNNTPLVIVLLIVAALAAGGWYKFFEERGAGSAQTDRAEQLAGELRDARSASDELGEQLEQARQETASLRSELEQVRAQNADAESVRQELAQAGAQIDSLRREAQAARSAFDKALAQAQAARAADRNEFENNARQAEQTHDAEREAWQQERADWQAERDQWQRDRDGLQADLDSQQRAADARIKQLTQELATAQGSEQTTRGELERLRALVAKLGEHEEMVQQLSSQLRNKNNDISQMESRMSELEQVAVEERARFAQLQDNMQDRLASREIELQRLSSKLTLIRVGSDILFETGSAELSTGGRETLDLVREVLAEYPDHAVSIEGHTDDVPIGPVTAQRYQSNWELSAARAASAVRYLNNLGVDAGRLRVIGRGAEDPEVENSDAAARARNRRIEISVLPADSYKVIVRD